MCTESRDRGQDPFATVTTAAYTVESTASAAASAATCNRLLCSILQYTPKRTELGPGHRRSVANSGQDQQDQRNSTVSSVWKAHVRWNKDLNPMVLTQSQRRSSCLQCWWSLLLRSAKVSFLFLIRYTLSIRLSQHEPKY